MCKSESKKDEKQLSSIPSPTRKEGRGFFKKKGSDCKQAYTGMHRYLSTHGLNKKPFSIEIRPMPTKSGSKRLPYHPSSSIIRPCLTPIVS